MATRTPNIGLAKPALSDTVSPSQFNENSDILDGLVSGLLTNMTAAQADILRLQSGSAIADVVAKTAKDWLDQHPLIVVGAVRDATRDWLDEHGVQTCYIEGNTFHIV